MAMAGAAGAAIRGREVPPGVTATPRTATSAFGGRWTAETRTGMAIGGAVTVGTPPTAAGEATLSAAALKARARGSPHPGLRPLLPRQRYPGGLGARTGPPLREAGGPPVLAGRPLPTADHPPPA